MALSKRKRLLLRLGWLCGCFALLLILGRNYIAKLAIETAGSYVLGNQVSVGQVSIGLALIEISSFRVRETLLEEEPQLEIPTIRVAPTCLAGLRSGSWFRYLVIEQPRVQLRFDADGNLLNKLPSFALQSETAESSPLRLPRMLICVKDAALVIHQTGKTPFTLSGCNLRADVADRIDLKVQVSNFLGGVLTSHTSLDPINLVGRTTLSLSPLRLSTRELSQLSLVPGSIQSLDLQAKLGLQAEIEHPGVQHPLIHHQLVMRADLTDIETPFDLAIPNDQHELAAISKPTRQIAVHATNRDGKLNLSIDGNLAGGRFYLQAQGDLADHIPKIEVSLDLSNLQVEQLLGRCVAGVPIEAVASAKGQFQATWQNRKLEFHGNLNQRLTDICVDSLPLAEVTTDIHCSGAVPELELSALTGVLQLESRSSAVDLTEVSQRYHAIALLGQIGFAAWLHIPLESIVNANTYTAAAKLQSTELQLDGLKVDPMELVASLRNGNVTVELSPCGVSCLAESQRDPNCVVQSIALADSTQLKIQAQASAPLHDICNPETWSLISSIETRGVAIYGEQLTDMHIDASLSHGRFLMPDQQLHWRDSVFTLGAQGALESRGTSSGILGSLNFHFDTTHIPLRNIASALSRFSSQPLRMSGIAGATGQITVVLPSGEFRGNGDLQLDDAQLNSTRVGAAQLKWSVDPQAFHLYSHSKSLLGGSYQLDATIPSLDWTRTTMDGHFEGIQLKRIGDTARLPLATSGSVEGRIHLDSIQDLRMLNATVQLTTRDASLGGIPVQFNTRQSKIRDGQLRLEGSMGALDGSCLVTATGSLQDIIDWSQAPNRSIHKVPLVGSLQGRNFSLQKANKLIDPRGAARPLSGQLELRIVRDQFAAEKGIVAVADASLSNLRWQQAILASRVSASGVMYASRVEINSIDGLVAEGHLSGRAAMSFDRKPSGTFQLAVENVNLRRAAMVVPGLAQTLSGTASLSSSGQIGSVSKATIKLQAANIHAGAIVIREVRMPLTLTFDARSQRLGLQCRSGTVHAGGGQVFIDSEGTWADGLTTANAKVDIRNIDSTKLLRSGALSVGMINGNVQLQCSRVRNPEDITGKFHVEFSQLKNLELPGYDQFTTLVKIPSFSGPSLGNSELGILDGRLGGGLIYLDRATLTKSGLFVLADGTATLQGRLALNVVAITNPSGPADGLVELASSPIMLAIPAPIALLAKANDVLKDRTVYVAVAGTTNKPVMHIQPGRGLSQDAMRFVLSASFGSQAANVAVNHSSQMKR